MKFNLSKIKSDIYKLARYMIAGGLGAGINFVIYFILLRVFNVWYILASIISFVLAIFAGFFLQKYMTFRNTDKSKIRKQIIYYYTFSIINLVINVLLLSLFVEILNMDQVLAKVLSLGLLAIWSYFIYQRVIFK